MKKLLTLLIAPLLFTSCGKDTIAINTEEGVQKFFDLLEQHIDDNTILNSTISMQSNPLENDISQVYFEYWGEGGAEPLTALKLVSNANGFEKDETIRENLKYFEKNTITYGELKKQLFIWQNISTGVDLVKEQDPDMVFAGVGAYEISFTGANGVATDYMTLQFTNKNDSEKLSGKRVLTNYYDIKFKIKDGFVSFED